MKKTIFFTVMALLCLNFWLAAQSFSTAVPMKVGDKLPEDFWMQGHQIFKAGKAVDENLSPYKGKVLVLDFWSSWCGSCLKKWPMLDSVQKQYGNEIKILLVNESRNGDDLAKVRLKFEQNPSIKLESIYADRLLGAAFPHQLLPHYVWISERGTVLAITGADFMQLPIIEQLLKERAIRQKK